MVDGGEPGDDGIADRAQPVGGQGPVVGLQSVDLALGGGDGRHELGEVVGNGVGRRRHQWVERRRCAAVAFEVAVSGGGPGRQHVEGADGDGDVLERLDRFGPTVGSSARLGHGGEEGLVGIDRARSGGQDVGLQQRLGEVGGGAPVRLARHRAGRSPEAVVHHRQPLPGGDPAVPGGDGVRHRGGQAVEQGERLGQLGGRRRPPAPAAGVEALVPDQHQLAERAGVGCEPADRRRRRAVVVEVAGADPSAPGREAHPSSAGRGHAQFGAVRLASEGPDELFGQGAPLLAPDAGEHRQLGVEPDRELVPGEAEDELVEAHGAALSSSAGGPRGCVPLRSARIGRDQGGRRRRPPLGGARPPALSTKFL